MLAAHPREPSNTLRYYSHHHHLSHTHRRCQSRAGRSAQVTWLPALVIAARSVACVRRLKMRANFYAIYAVLTTSFMPTVARLTGEFDASMAIATRHYQATCAETAIVFVSPASKAEPCNCLYPNNPKSPRRDDFKNSESFFTCHGRHSAAQPSDSCSDCDHCPITREAHTCSSIIPSMLQSGSKLRRLGFTDAALGI